MAAARSSASPWSLPRFSSSPSRRRRRESAQTQPTVIATRWPKLITRQLQSVADLPATQAILPANNPSANYYHLVMREPLETRAQRFYYGSQLPQFGDLRLPKGRGPHPVAIVIHGGAWGSAVSLHYTASLSAALTCAGVATWNIEYRRLGGGGGWPQTFQDVGAAADFLRDLATRFPLDLSSGSRDRPLGRRAPLALARRAPSPTTGGRVVCCESSASAGRGAPRRPSRPCEVHRRGPTFRKRGKAALGWWIGC